MFSSFVFITVNAIIGTMALQITSLTIVYSTVYSRTDQRKHQSSASLVFVSGIHRWPVNSPHKGPVTLKMLPIDDVIMFTIIYNLGKKLIYNTRSQYSLSKFRIYFGYEDLRYPHLKHILEMKIPSFQCRKSLRGNKKVISRSTSANDGKTESIYWNGCI